MRRENIPPLFLFYRCFYCTIVENFFGAWYNITSKIFEGRGMGEEKKNSFFEEVYKVVARIPAGKVMSYGQIARVLGAPRSARQVGWAMRCCPDDIPWQRVVKDSGEIAGGGHADFRRILLEEERVSFLPDGRADMEKCRYVPTIELLLMEDEE